MTETSVIQRASGTRSAGPADTRRPATRIQARLARFSVALPSLLTLAVMLWGITTPSYWRDEAATLSATRRPFGELLSMLQSVDLVHCVYYISLWPVVHIFGDAEFVVRLPSAIVMALAAFGVTLIGRRLLSPSAGVLSGLVFAAFPTVSEYGQEARSPAFALAAAVLATYLLLVAVERGGAGRFAGYSAALALMVVTNVLSVLFIPVHAVYIWRARRHGRRWLWAVAAALLAAAPLILAAMGQRSAVDWIPRLEGWVIAAFLRPLFGWTLVFLVPILIVVAVVKHRARRDAGAPDLVPLLAWLVLPGLLLLAVSLVKPFFQFRYVVFCLPAVVLLTGYAIDLLRTKARIVVAVAFVLLVIPAQVHARDVDAHGGDNLRSIANVLGTHKQQGDAIVYYLAYWRHLEAAYPEKYRGLYDVAERMTPVQAGNLSGGEVSATELRRRLGGVTRIWFLEVGKPDRVDRAEFPAFSVKRELLTGREFAPAGSWTTGEVRLRLLVRR